MTLETPSYQPPEEQQSQEQRKPIELSDWELIDLGGEKFKVKRDRVFPTVHEGGKYDWDVNIYDHIESGMQITILSLGLRDDDTKPAIVRADYGCPCMIFHGWEIQNHDCSNQRSNMLEAITEVGHGAIAVIDEHTAAGNGRGRHLVYDQSTIQHLAEKRGEDVPSMEKIYTDQGYSPFDVRHHDYVAKTLAHFIGTSRPVIPAMSSTDKIQKLRDEGMNVIEEMRVEFITSKDGAVNPLLRRSTQIESPGTVSKPGTYLTIDVNEDMPVRLPLTKGLYNALFERKPTRLRQQAMN